MVKQSEEFKYLKVILFIYRIATNYYTHLTHNINT